jgi:hypothetical protein
LDFLQALMLDGVELRPTPASTSTPLPARPKSEHVPSDQNVPSSANATPKGVRARSKQKAYTTGVG